MPAYGPLLEELGAEFGSDNTKMYYNGAYILSEFAPQETKIYVKNQNNWDAEHVYIDKIVERYNAEANTLAPQMVQTGEIDYATIESNIVDDWLADPERSKLISKSRVEVDYSYFIVLTLTRSLIKHMNLTTGELLLIMKISVNL